MLNKGGVFIETKVCTKCKKELPATEDYFYKQKYTSKRTGEVSYWLQSWCKNCCIKKSSKYQHEHLDKAAINQKKYVANPEKREDIRNRQKRFRESGKMKQWWDNNKEKVKTYGKNRRNKNHDMTKKEWIACKEYFKNEEGEYCCAYCGLPISKNFRMYKGKLQNIDLHKEHVIYNGVDNLSNCVPSCYDCNICKWEFDMEEWYKKQPFFSEERLTKIYKWLNEDHKLYITGKRKIKRKN